MSVGQVTPLDTLRTRLVASFGAGLRRSEEWADEAADRRMVQKVKELHDGLGQPPDPATVAAAVAHFRRTGEPDGWRGLKRACFGAGMADERGWCLVSDESLREKLFALAEGQKEARKRIRCYQFLLSSYWAFPLSSAELRARAGWLALREWLDNRLQAVSRDFGTVPGWFQTLVDHRNLLRDDPCGRYGAKLLSGDGSELHEVLTGLGIPSDSWVPEEAVLAQIRAACGLSHEVFRNVLPDLLKVAMGKAEISPHQSLMTRCVAMMVSRYAHVPGTPEHHALRDAAVAVIGNPWLRRASWDSSVVDERGRPDNTAREMVFGWLKQRLIKDFFELLSEDGSGDSRRLKYWLRFEPHVGDMWFALGASARLRRDEAFRDFLVRASGRLLNLDGTTAENNAFIMRMGSHVIMEFGESGHALYLYRWDDLPPVVSTTLLSGKERVDVTIHQLKNSDRIATEKPLRHVDRPKSLVSWEQKFDEVLCPVLGCKPEGRPAFIPDLEVLLRQFRVRAEDKRPQGGALWIYADDSHAPFNTSVKTMGFTYRSPRGWFKE